MQYIGAIADDDWVCLCGNTALTSGFFPCSQEGEQVEPTPEEWATNCYVCEQCGRIIRQSDRRVVGVRTENTLTEGEIQAISD